MLTKKKLYVLTRKDLGKTYAGVQAGHAVAQYLIDNPNTEWRNNTLIYLSVQNEKSLLYWIYRLDNLNYQFSVYREPDKKNQVTAVALLEDGDLFVDLGLLS